MLSTDPVGGIDRMNVSSVESLPDLVLSRSDLQDIVAEMTQNNRLHMTLHDLVQHIMSRRTPPTPPSSEKPSSPLEDTVPMDADKSTSETLHTPIFTKSKFCSPNDDPTTESSPEFSFKTPRKVFPAKTEEVKKSPAAASNTFEFESLKEQVNSFSQAQSSTFPTFAAPGNVSFNVSLPTKSKTKNKLRQQGVSTFGASAPASSTENLSSVNDPPPAPAGHEPMEEDTSMPPPPPSDFVFQFSSFHIGADKPKTAKHAAEGTAEELRPHKHSTTDTSHMKENIIETNATTSSTESKPANTAQQPFRTGEVPVFEFSTSSFTVGATASVTPTKKKTPKKHSPRKTVQRPIQTVDDEANATTSAASTPASKMEEEEKEDVRRMEALANLMKNQGKDSYNNQNYALALDAYTKALNAAPPLWQDRPMVLGNRAATFMMLERYVEAVDDCDSALKMDYTSVRMHNRRGRALLKLGLLEEATSSFMFCISVLDSIRDPETQGMKDTISGSLKQIALIRTLLLRIENLFTDKNYKRIIVTCDEILHVAPFSRQALIHKCRAMSHLHQWQECRTLLESYIVKLHPSIARLYAHPMTSFPLPTDFAWRETGAGNVDVDQYAVTQLVFSLGDQLGQVYISLLKNMSLCRQCTVSVMQTLINILTPIIPPNKISPPRFGIPESDWSWTEEERHKIRAVLEAKHLADKQFRSGNYVEAMSQYGEVLQLDPDAHIWNAIMYGNRAAAAMRLGKFAEAVSDCHQSIARDPDYARAYLRRARAQKALGQHAAAIRDFQKYISSTPRPSDVNEVHAEMQEAIMQKNIAENDDDKSRGRFDRGKTYHRKAFESSSRFRRDDDSTDSSEYSNFKKEEFYDFIRGLNGRGGPRSDGAAAGARSAHQERKYQHRTHYSRSNTHQKQQQRPPPPEDTTPDHYKQLGIAKTATEQEIKTAYRKLALKYHPDKNKDEAAVDMFKSITEAYSVLSDKTSRRRYDEIRMFSTRF